MKKISFVLTLLLCILFMIAGCNNSSSPSLEKSQNTVNSLKNEDYTAETVPDEISGYIHAEFDKYNSPAKENGLKNTKVFTDGTITEIFEYKGNLVGTLESVDGNWTLVFCEYDSAKDSQYRHNYSHEHGRIMGAYMGFSEYTKKPAIYVERITINGKTDTLNQIDYDSLNNEHEETTYEPTEIPTEPPTEKPTEPLAEAPKIINNSSSGGFWAKGNGDYVAEGLHVTDCAVLHFEYDGNSNFIVTLYQGDERLHSIVNEIGAYSGDSLVAGTGTYDLVIKSSGNWNITSSGLSIDDTTSFSGHGNTVTGITSHGGGNWHLTHNGNSNFIVVPYSPDGDRKYSIVNEIGPYDGIVKAPKGNIFFEVKADGAWTIEKQ